MAAAQRGDSPVYHQLLSELRHWLTGFFVKRLPASLVDDIVQDTLISIHTKRHTYDPARPFRPWVAAIARYKWVDRLRSLGRQSSDELSDDLAQGDHESAVTSSILLHDLLGRLKPAQEEAIRLVKLTGLSVAEAAQQTSKSPSLIKINIHRGMAKLAQIAREFDDGH